MYKIFWFAHGQSMKLLLKRSITGFTSHTACVVQQTRNTHTATGVKTRTRELHLALKGNTVLKHPELAFLKSCRKIHSISSGEMN